MNNLLVFANAVHAKPVQAPAAGRVEGLPCRAVRYAVAAAERGARRTLTPTRRADVGLSRNGAGGFGEVGSAPRLRRTREARPLSFCALAYTFRLFWSISTEEALTEFGTATPTALGGPCPAWEGGQRAPYEAAPIN